MNRSKFLLLKSTVIPRILEHNLPIGSLQHFDTHSEVLVYSELVLLHDTAAQARAMSCHGVPPTQCGALDLDDVSRPFRPAFDEGSHNQVLV